MKKTFRALILIVLIAAAWHYRAPLAALAHRIMQPESRSGNAVSFVLRAEECLE